MQHFLLNALAAGYGRIVAWADILDRINVYPVPDGDTGRNLVMSLSPLSNTSFTPQGLAREIMLSARGNSGNIAASFLSGFLACNDLRDLTASAAAGRDLAYKAVPNPQPGTMLTLFDTLLEALRNHPPGEADDWAERVIRHLEEAVRLTTEQLSVLKEAGVVDAGALGMLVFLDPALNVLAGREIKQSAFTEDLKHSFSLSETWQEREHQGYCLDVVLQIGKDGGEIVRQIVEVAESVAAIPDGEYLKVHLHATDRDRVRQGLAGLGTILRWSEDDLAEQTLRFTQPRKKQAIHIMTDAAGSITRDVAQELGVTLLNSYINIGSSSLPETFVDPSHLFSAMREGVKVSTGQASVAVRHECYSNVMKLHDRVLYLCVGSFYTGNYAAAMNWKAQNDPQDRLIVMDTGMASGRLGLAARVTAEISLCVPDHLEVVAFAEKALRDVKEYIFLDKLQFLAAGGRMSKTGAFFGDLLHIKPIVSPFPDGARKMGVVRTHSEQETFAFLRLEEALKRDSKTTLLLEYSDNRDWLEKEIKPEIQRRFPYVRVIVQPLSLTSAAHMGPGTWGVAFFSDHPQGDEAHV